MPEAAITAYELERGKPPPDFAHSATEVCLFGALGKAVGTRFTVLSELTLAMPDGCDLTPDVCVYPPMKPDWLHDVERMTTMPRLVMEITTSGHGVSALLRRIERLFAAGVESAWVIEPFLRIIAVYRPGSPRPMVLTGGEVIDPATGLAVRVEEVFPS